MTILYVFCHDVRKYISYSHWSFLIKTDHFRLKLAIYDQNWLFLMKTDHFGPKLIILEANGSFFYQKLIIFSPKLVIFDRKLHFENSRVFPDADNMFRRIINVFIFSYIQSLDKKIKIYFY